MNKIKNFKNADYTAAELYELLTPEDKEVINEVINRLLAIQNMQKIAPLSSNDTEQGAQAN